MEVECDRVVPSANTTNSDLTAYNPESATTNRIDDIVTLSRFSAAIVGLRNPEAIFRIGLNGVPGIIRVHARGA